MNTLLLLGTKKGLVIAESDAARKDWTVRGPFCDGWAVNHAVYDPRTASIYAAATNAWYGSAVWRSDDRGETWTHSSEGITLGEEMPVSSLWSLGVAGQSLLLGAEPASLFKSEDGGRSWRHLSGLREHPTAAKFQPGGAGLILHSIESDPSGRSVAVAISVGSVFVSGDGGETWDPRGKGLPTPDPNEFYFSCVHHIAARPGGFGRFFQQNHQGTFRTEDCGQTWIDIGAGLPSTFGFAAAVHPREADTFYCFPLNGDSLGRFPADGAAAVYRSRDAGASWEACRDGLPQENAMFGVYRQGMATDTHDPAGVYVGTSTGNLFVSSDEGDTWRQAAAFLPPILSVEAAVIPG
jgi:photosystem II stability/assembly factor-like uncharacterized protein